MKAVLMEGFGGVEVLKVGEAEKPAAGEDQALVKVYATTVNRPDLVQREGKYPPPPPGSGRGHRGAGCRRQWLEGG